MPLLEPEERSPTIIWAEASTKNAGPSALDLPVGDGPDLLVGDRLDLKAGDGVLDLPVDLGDCRRAEVGPVSSNTQHHVLDRRCGILVRDAFS